MTVGLKTLAYVISTVKLLAGHDSRIDVQTPPTGLDLIFAAAFLTSWGSMCYLVYSILVARMKAVADIRTGRPQQGGWHQVLQARPTHPR